MPLHDLREELRQRLTLIDIERGQIRERLVFLEESEVHVRALLSYEEMRMRTDDPNLVLPFLSSPRGDGPERTKLTLFLRDKMADGQTWTLEDLKKAAEDSKMEFDGKQPGRVLHFALLGMAQNGTAEMVSKGTWRLRI
jgi:hypothetical protein